MSLTGGVATFEDKNVGTGKMVTLTGAALEGDDAGNYDLTGVATTTADITQLDIAGSFTGDSKVYDGNLDATVADRFLAGVFTGDTVSLTGGTASFVDKNVGTDKTVTLSGASLGGADAGNYNLTGVATTTADITALEVTGAFNSASKEYDGNTSAAASNRRLVGKLSGDTVSLVDGTATFANKNVGTDKMVTLAGASLAGADAGNYSLVGVATTTADITQLDITGAFTSANKEYDATRAAEATNRRPVGAVDGDDVSLTGGVATFADKNVGTGKTVTLTGAVLAGDDAGNYNLTHVATTSAAVSAKPVTGSFTADDKVYDGNADATVLGRFVAGWFSGDDVSLSGGSASFAQQERGTGKTVTLTGAVLSGVDAGNYNLTEVATTTASITKLGITGAFDSATKIYDRNTDAAATNRRLNGVLGSDDVTLDGGTASFDTKNVGAGKTVTLTGAALAGGGAGNYRLDSVATTTASITKRDIAGTFESANRVYNGGTAAAASNRQLNGVLGDDDVSLDGGIASFGTKNVGTGKTVTLTGAVPHGWGRGQLQPDRGRDHGGEHHRAGHHRRVRLRGQGL